MQDGAARAVRAVMEEDQALALERARVVNGPAPSPDAAAGAVG